MDCFRRVKRDLLGSFKEKKMKQSLDWHIWDSFSENLQSNSQNKTMTSNQPININPELSYFEEVGLQQKLSSPVEKSHAKNNLEPTSFGPETELLSRSFKKKVYPYEISFEANFMDEHLSALQKQAENLMESAFIIPFQKEVAAFRFWKEGLPQEGFISNIFENQLFSTAQKNQFHKDLETEQNFLNLLKHVAEKTTANITKELVFISFLIWEKYLKLKTSNTFRFDVEKAKDEFIEEHYEKLFSGEGGIRTLNLSEANIDSLRTLEEQKAAFKKFLQFWVTTVFLVIEGYFQNPYSEGGAIKRERDYDYSDFQDDFSSVRSSQCSILGAPQKRYFSFE